MRKPRSRPATYSISTTTIPLRAGQWDRARLGGRFVVDSRAALLLWEPRRIVPTYAVPDKDVQAGLVPVEPAAESDVPVLHPGIPFAVHSTPGLSSPRFVELLNMID